MATKDNDRHQMISTDTGGQFTENKGVTMESGFPIKPVSAPPSEPAGQPSSPAPSSGAGGASTSED
jgi:hypothetical protein